MYSSCFASFFCLYLSTSHEIPIVSMYTYFCKQWLLQSSRFGGGKSQIASPNQCGMICFFLPVTKKDMVQSAILLTPEALPLQQQFWLMWLSQWTITLWFANSKYSLTIFYQKPVVRAVESFFSSTFQMKLIAYFCQVVREVLPLENPCKRLKQLD